MTEKLNDDEKRKTEEIFQSFKNGEYSSNDATKIIGNEKKLSEMVKSVPLKEFSDKIKQLFNLVKDYSSGKYSNIPIASIVSIIGSLLYVISPIDLIPDFIPVIGLLDDAAIISSCLVAFGHDIKKYESWKDEFDGKEN